jgi:hypothetical protein
MDLPKLRINISANEKFLKPRHWDHPLWIPEQEIQNWSKYAPSLRTRVYPEQGCRHHH